MLNQIVLVGRICTDKPVKGEIEGKEISQIKIAVPRSYKNEDGTYSTDFIPVILFGTVADKTFEYCKKGDMVGIKGAISTFKKNDKDILYIRGEKVTFLSSGGGTLNDDE